MAAEPATKSETTAREFRDYLKELQQSVDARQKELAKFMRKNLAYQMYSRSAGTGGGYVRGTKDEG